MNKLDKKDYIIIFLKNFEEFCNIFKKSHIKYEYSYYFDLKSEDTEFLDGITGLKDYTPAEKMLVFHCYLELASSLLFLKAIKNTEISFVQKINSELACIPLEFAESIYQEIGDILPNEASSILENLYPALVNSVSRKSSGMEYTQQSIVNFMLDEVGYISDIFDKKVLDPSCGSGAFLIPIVARTILRYQELNYSSSTIIRALTEQKMIVGVDINPGNVHLSKLRYLLELKGLMDNIEEHVLLDCYKKIPVYVGNTLTTLSILDEVPEYLIEGSYDFVVGNPPYIRLQRLPKEFREDIKHNFVSAVGRFDLYVCFIEKAIQLLKQEGKIAYITSNKFLTTNYGSGIRNYLSKNLKIESLIDLNDTKYFEAAVLPIIIVGEKKEVSSSYQFPYMSLKINNHTEKQGAFIKDIFAEMTRIKKVGIPVSERYTINNSFNNINVELSFSNVESPRKDDYWNFASKSDETLKNYLMQIDHYELKDIADVCVGIKTTADSVFVHPMTKTFVETKQFENELIYPLLQSFNISKWTIDWEPQNPKDRYILYPHTARNGKTVGVEIDQYPNCKEYLFENREQLEGRSYLSESKSRKWYECWVPQKLDKFLKPKIVTKDIAEKNSFALDIDGYLCQGNTFFINIKDSYLSNNVFPPERLNLYLLGILNSNILEFFQKTISGSLYSKKVRYTTSNLNRWIIPKIDKNNLDTVNEIIDIVEAILKPNGNNIDLEVLLNEEVSKLFKLTELQRIQIAEFLMINS
ncbi:Eco57I restriction-modification methylase domain-containing protein [Paenibacillus sp. NPDC057934]|uniref:Eco57I restriction-modification methylase domain-containing protein n=1 Tax=Paenibacillus sp. NPDC057934 TaxID=3346282 RepID=UPI0036DAF956